MFQGLRNKLQGKYIDFLINKLQRKYIDSRIQSCADFGDFLVVSIIPLNGDKDEVYFTGTIFPAISKKTGKIFEYDITSDPEAYLNAKEVPVSNR